MESHEIEYGSQGDESSQGLHDSFEEIVDVGDLAPDWTLNSQMGPIAFHPLIEGKWGLVVTFNKAFDPVATTDIGALSKMVDEFEARNIAIVTMGRDSVTAYRKWIKDIEELQSCKVTIPLVSDTECNILKKFGCAKRSSVEKEIIPHCMGVILVDLDKRVRSVMKYGPNTGRNFYEIIRLFDALHMATYHSVVTPSNWGMGQDVMVNNDVSNEEAQEMFPKGFVTIKKWFRLVSAPENTHDRKEND